VFGVVGWRATVANDAVRSRVDQLRRNSVQELTRAANMLVTLREYQLNARELLEGSKAQGSSDDETGSAEEPGAVPAGIEGGLMAFERQLDASRRATEAALAAVGPVGSMPAAERQRRELSAWLDKLRVELAVHHALVDQLRDLARSDPETAEQYLEARVYPHYVDVLQPLIQGYQDVAERDLREALGVVSVALTDADRDNTVLTILAIALALILGVFTTRTIAQPISELRDAADRLGAGDLTARVTDRASDEIGALAVDFNGMAERLQTATTSKTYVEDILRSMDDILVVADLRGLVRRVNRAAVEHLGWSERELIGRNVGTLIRGDAEATGGPEMVGRSGTALPVACSQANLHDRSGRRQGQIWVARDVRRQKQVEEELRRTLAQKDALLREVHHRVKNNLQVISSLLRLQAAGSSSPQAARLFQESESRIHSMALIHEQLCRSGDHTRIDFRDYVEGLTRNVLASAGEAERPIRVALDVDPVPLDLDIAISCGLILNELLSNALKYAFPDGRDGVISVTFRCVEGSATMVVADNGIGLPVVPKGQEPAPSLGLRLVTALVGQLHGSWLVEGEGGTRFTLTFRIDGEPAAAVAQG
ncbi:MAG TPA: histidine kinase dimerization/phosphoacceptor domain -containing protein, partial [Candidatus Binatia bacterium]|nr:histidine kinase dimerization/phosphoacceptor domain -containing protein [Candidatus Binatia bacterium]